MIIQLLFVFILSKSVLYVYTSRYINFCNLARLSSILIRPCKEISCKGTFDINCLNLITLYSVTVLPHVSGSNKQLQYVQNDHNKNLINFLLFQIQIKKLSMLIQHVSRGPCKSPQQHLVYNLKITFHIPFFTYLLIFVTTVFYTSSLWKF